MPIKNKNQMHGLTLIEAMITLAIAAILLALAAPSFQKQYEKWQVLQATQALQSTLLLARSEAIKRNGNVGMRKNTNTAACSNASSNQEWSCGWFIYLDQNSNGSWNTNEPKLQEIQLSGTVNIMHNSGGINIKFDRLGKASGLNAKGFTFSPESQGISSTATHSLCMSSGGRIRIVNDFSCN